MDVLVGAIAVSCHTPFNAQVCAESLQCDCRLIMKHMDMTPSPLDVPLYTVTIFIQYCKETLGVYSHKPLALCSHGNLCATQDNYPKISESFPEDRVDFPKLYMSTSAKAALFTTYTSCVARRLRCNAQARDTVPCTVQTLAGESPTQEPRHSCRCCCSAVCHQLHRPLLQ